MNCSEIEMLKQLVYVNVIGFPGGNLEPVEALHVHGECFKILGENDDNEHFPWEFVTGEVVKCENVKFYEDESGLVTKSKCECRNA